MTTTNSNQNPKRRWLQFSLRGLLVLTVLIALTLGWMMHKVQQQRDAVAALEKMGCFVRYEFSGPEWLRKLLGDRGIRKVTGLEGDYSEVTDAAMVHLRGLPELRYLRLPDTKMTDAGLEHIQELSQLTELNLCFTGVTDAGLVHLEGLTQLEALELAGTEITDAGLVHLRGLTRLLFINLSGTKVTDTGFQELRKALPNTCGVH
jgi:hypothetical protein